MFLKAFIKPNFIAFYKDENKYLLLNEQFKKDKTIFSENKEFKNKKDLIKYISEIQDDNPQTYISTFITSQNQGVINTCNKQKYKEAGIEVDNIKILCIKNKYSFYTTLYEIMKIKKEFNFIDLLYSAYALIDYKSTLRHNSMYLLIINDYLFILIYNNHTPVYGDIIYLIENIEEDFQQNEEIEDISNIDLEENLDETINENIDEEIENIDEETVKESTNIEHLDKEYKILNNIKTALKEYYENGNDFIEKIFIFDTINLKNDIVNMINDELFIESNLTKIDLLKLLNEISRKNV